MLAGPASPGSIQPVVPRDTRSREAWRAGMETNNGRENVGTLVVLGTAGDLPSRLLPGPGRLLAEQPDRRITLIGAGRPAAAAPGGG